MNAQNALNEFYLKYDEKTIKLIQELANSKSSYKDTVPRLELMDIDLLSTTFNEYIDGYCEYIESDKMEHDIVTIKESYNRFIDDMVYKTKKYRYIDLPKYIGTYITCISNLNEYKPVENLLLCENVNNVFVGLGNDMITGFIETINTKFNNNMDIIVRISNNTTPVFKGSKKHIII